MLDIYGAKATCAHQILCHDALVGIEHVMGGERFAVVERDARLEFELPRCALRVGLERFCEEVLNAEIWQEAGDAIEEVEPASKVNVVERALRIERLQVPPPTNPTRNVPPRLIAARAGDLVVAAEAELPKAPSRLGVRRTVPAATLFRRNSRRSIPCVGFSCATATPSTRSCCDPPCAFADRAGETCARDNSPEPHAASRPHPLGRSKIMNL